MSKRGRYDPGEVVVLQDLADSYHKEHPLLARVSWRDIASWFKARDASDRSETECELMTARSVNAIAVQISHRVAADDSVEAAPAAAAAAAAADAAEAAAATHPPTGGPTGGGAGVAAGADSHAAPKRQRYTYNPLSTVQRVTADGQRRHNAQAEKEAAEAAAAAKARAEKEAAEAAAAAKARAEKEAAEAAAAAKARAEKEAAEAAAAAKAQAEKEAAEAAAAAKARAEKEAAEAAAAAKARAEKEAAEAAAAAKAQAEKEAAEAAAAAKAQIILLQQTQGQMSSMFTTFNREAPIGDGLFVLPRPLKGTACAITTEQLNAAMTSIGAAENWIVCTGPTVRTPLPKSMQHYNYAAAAAHKSAFIASDTGQFLLRSCDNQATQDVMRQMMDYMIMHSSELRDRSKQEYTFRRLTNRWNDLAGQFDTEASGTGSHKCHCPRDCDGYVSLADGMHDHDELIPAFLHAKCYPYVAMLCTTGMLCVARLIFNRLNSSRFQIVPHSCNKQTGKGKLAAAPQVGQVQAAVTIGKTVKPAMRESASLLFFGDADIMQTALMGSTGFVQGNLGSSSGSGSGSGSGGGGAGARASSNT
jgi:hypothetical protein